MTDYAVVEAAGIELRVSNPAKMFFPAVGVTKLDLVEYYLSVVDGALRGCYQRPTVLKRYPGGVEGELFFQKRVPASRPDWLRTVTVSFPSGRSAEELCPYDAAHVVWAVNLGCLDLNPWAVRDDDLEHPDELRVDLDPMPGVDFSGVRRIALAVGELLHELGMEGFPKTSGSRGIHVNIPIAPRWGFLEVRRAALALAREIERRHPDMATSKWWKEERGSGCSSTTTRTPGIAPSPVPTRCGPRPMPAVSAPLRWDEVGSAELDDFTVATVPARYAEIGDPAAGADDVALSLQPLLDLARRDEEEGLGDAPWPPNFPKQPGEPRRVRPSARRKDPADTDTSASGGGEE